MLSVFVFHVLIHPKLPFCKPQPFPPSDLTHTEQIGLTSTLTTPWEILFLHMKFVH